MVLAQPTFRDATRDAPDRIHFPEVVEGFEALGFRRIGRLARTYEGGLEAAATDYAPEHHDAFVDHKSVPMVVLRSPDATALVLVDWWWDMPDVRLRSVMEDGSVVETWRAWDRVLPLPAALARGRHKLDMLAEQTLVSTSPGGRSVVAVPGRPAELWEAHRRRMAGWAGERRTAPAPLQTIDDAVALSTRLAAHDRRVTRRNVSVARSAVLTLMLVPVLVLLLTWFTDLLSHVPTAVVLSVLALDMAAAVVLLPRLHRLRYVEMLRPRLLR